MKHIQLFEEHSKKKSRKPTKEEIEDAKMGTMVVAAMTGPLDEKEETFINEGILVGVARAIEGVAKAAFDVLTMDLDGQNFMNFCKTVVDDLNSVNGTWVAEIANEMDLKNAEALNGLFFASQNSNAERQLFLGKSTGKTFERKYAITYDDPTSGTIAFVELNKKNAIHAFNLLSQALVK